MKCRTRVSCAVFFAALVGPSAARGLASDEPSPPERTGSPNLFFAFDNGFRGTEFASPAARAKLLAELGYGGVGYSGVRQLPEMLKELDRHKLKMVSIYTGLRIDGEEPKHDAGLEEAIEALRGRKTILWLYVLSKSHPPSSPAGDELAVGAIRAVADLAEKAKLRVALYPHAGFWIQSLGDAVRVAKKVDRPNVGASFNLCHWLKVEPKADLRKALKEALPHLFAVSINGANTDGKDWSELIQTLDRGTFDNRKLLKWLHELGYTGPVGLQCYAVPGDSRDNLERSLAAWRRLSRTRS